MSIIEWVDSKYDFPIPSNIKDEVKQLLKEIEGLKADKETLANSLVIESNRANELNRRIDKVLEESAVNWINKTLKGINKTLKGGI